MNQVIQGDCLNVMQGMPDNSVDAVVTDPPYGLSFMGKKWDYDVPTVEVWREVLRVLKPGGHLLSFAGTRTHHRMAVNIEDAGFDLRDTLMWVYGSGFPKSHDVSKAIDKAAGAEREIVGIGLHAAHRRSQPFGQGAVQDINIDTRTITAPATDAARQWAGWGSALKPAFEPITLARKPLQGTIAQNVQEWGTGALNIDGCRSESDGVNARANKGAINVGTSKGWRMKQCVRQWDGTAGRWPANFIHDGSPEIVECFPETVSGNLQPHHKRGAQVNTYGKSNGAPPSQNFGGDSGSAARFFKQCPDTDPEDAETRRLIYQGKATKRDRDEGLEGFEEGAYTLKNDCPEHIKKEIEAWLTSRF